MHCDKSYSNPYNKPVVLAKPNTEPKKMLQVPVIIGFGEEEELIVSQILIAPPNPSIFRIISIDKEVIITNFKLVSVCGPDNGKPSWKAKVIIDGFVDKNILYKTITDFTGQAVGGPVFQFTTRIPFATFVEVKSEEPIFLTDQVEILSAFVEGEKEELLDPNDVAIGAPDFAVTYNALLEKMIVKIKLKITRIEHVYIK